MEEKIKIYIPESVNNILLKDMERFEFFKKDGSFNKNEFYNTLILNYYESYEESQSDFFNHIKETIKTSSKSSETDINDMASRILTYVDTKTNNLDEARSDVTLALKPTKLTSDAFSYIQNCCLEGATMSSYFRNMFASYSLLPQDKRERIIFKHNFELIEKAIKEDKKIYFTTTGKDSSHIASPYKIANSKEELFNYLLAEYNYQAYSFRVGRMRKIKVMNETRRFKDAEIRIFEMMEEHGPQFSYSFKDIDREIKVYLTERGKQMYKTIYLHRPPCIRIDGNYHYFKCSSGQAFQYFCRFGRNAVIIEPKDLLAKMHEYYSMADKTYRKSVKQGELPK